MAQGNRNSEFDKEGKGGKSNSALVDFEVKEALAKGETLDESTLLEILNKTTKGDSRIAIVPNKSLQNQVSAPLSKIYTVLDYASDVVITEQVTTAGVFPGNVGSISAGAFYSSSNQAAATKTYYITVADGTTTSSNALFDITWGSNVSSTPSASQAMYKQYANILLNADDDTFTMSGSTDANSVIAFNFKRARIKENLDPGNWEMHLYSASATRSFIDNFDNTNASSTIAGQRVTIVSGSIANGVFSTDPWGYMYPNLGIILFDGDKFSGSFAYSSSLDMLANLDFLQARNEVRLKDINYFCRIMNKDYTYSNNPTFVTGSDGTYRFSTFAKDPKTFITAIGLYNDSNELLASARLSSPSENSFEKETSVTVKLSF
jgi:hypothetical protein